MRKQVAVISKKPLLPAAALSVHHLQYLKLCADRTALAGPTAVIAAPTAGSVLSAPTPEGVTVVFDASRSQAEAGGSISSFRWAITGPGDRQRVLVAQVGVWVDGWCGNLRHVYYRSKPLRCVTQGPTAALSHLLLLLVCVQGPTASLLLPPGSAYTARLTVTSPAGQSSSDTVAFAVVTAAAAAAGGEAAAGLGTASPAAAVLQPTPVAAAVPGATDVLPSPAVITPTDTAAAGESRWWLCHATNQGWPQVAGGLAVWMCQL